jgi:hypothetical protein
MKLLYWLAIFALIALIVILAAPLLAKDIKTILEFWGFAQR